MRVANYIDFLEDLWFAFEQAGQPCEFPISYTELRDTYAITPHYVRLALQLAHVTCPVSLAPDRKTELWAMSPITDYEVAAKKVMKAIKRLRYHDHLDDHVTRARQLMRSQCGIQGKTPKFYPLLANALSPRYMTRVRTLLERADYNESQFLRFCVRKLYAEGVAFFNIKK